MKIKKGDSVVVIAGDEKGATVRKVISVVDGGKKVVVEGVNRAFKHVRRGHPKSPSGGRLHVEMPIDASNIQLHCSACNKATRIGYRYADDGAKERFCRKCGTAISSISRPKSTYARQS